MTTDQNKHPIKDIGNNPFANKFHHSGGGFKNPPDSPFKDGRRSLGMLKLIADLAVSCNKSFEYPSSHVMSRDESLCQLKGHDTADSISWLGQACFYLTVGGVKILTDPFLSKRASPTSFSGPKRLTPSPLKITDLEVDVIVISHNHYDHLDLKTLSLWRDKNTPIVTTLGTSSPIKKLGYKHVIELDWYQQTVVNGALITCCPAYHFSGRSLFDSDKSLWGSFIFKAQGKSIYFAGDTGYGSEFSRIKELVGEVDVALVPIGAYSPRNVMSQVHASPEEGLQIGLDLGAKTIVPMHWGTVRLTNEPMMEPIERFELAVKSLNAAPKTNGETFGIGQTKYLDRMLVNGG